MTITLRDVTYVHRGREGRRTVFQDASLDAAPGGILGILGGRGSGKSTLIGLLRGTLTPDAGKIVRNGRIAPPFGQIGTLSRHETARNNVRFFSRLNGLDPEDAIRYVEAVAQLGPAMDQHIDLMPSEARARLVYTMGYLVPHEIYLVDETFGPSATEIRTRCHALLRGLAQDATVILTTKSPAILRDCDRFALIEDHAIVPYRTVREAILRFKDLARADAATEA